jgi:hypothetical protein
VFIEAIGEGDAGLVGAEAGEAGSLVNWLRVESSAQRYPYHLHIVCICAVYCIHLSEIQDAAKARFLERRRRRDFSFGLVPLDYIFSR